MFFLFFFPQTYASTASHYIGHPRIPKASQESYIQIMPWPLLPRWIPLATQLQIPTMPTWQAGESLEATSKDVSWFGWGKSFLLFLLVLILIYHKSHVPKTQWQTNSLAKALCWCVLQCCHLAVRSKDWNSNSQIWRSLNVESHSSDPKASSQGL